MFLQRKKLIVLIMACMFTAMPTSQAQSNATRLAFTGLGFGVGAVLGSSLATRALGTISKGISARLANPCLWRVAGK